MNVMIKQENGFALFTEDSWKNHLNMVRLQFLQEMTLEETTELVEDYEQSFELVKITTDQVKAFKNQFGLEVNKTRKIESVFGQLTHF